MMLRCLYLILFTVSFATSPLRAASTAEANQPTTPDNLLPNASFEAGFGAGMGSRQ
jgi:hypothetical protein